MIPGQRPVSAQQGFHQQQHPQIQPQAPQAVLQRPPQASMNSPATAGKETATHLPPNLTAASVRTPPSTAASTSTPGPSVSTPTPAPPATAKPLTNKAKATPKAKAASILKRKPSVASKNDKLIAVQPAEPAPKVVPSPDPSTSLKRKREDDSLAVRAGAPDVPSPKRPKTESERDCQPHPTVVERQRQIDAVETPEDAVAFFEQFSRQDGLC
ncbi:hypothetical protein PUNSTDRAFT_138157 [Punctularia strigosozonata HHB-11173 SS5]|uniref:Uncharacterized protein n=1 Tax=Punctularia strigosozonata (strain HHB-11173) TaxID=741275 RepID=R7S5S4_PUNST|nr:uncharacterized protein PUNSTDRAFT_138157 [Punctularia strigosozonata HHB-11173 SS5]EIN04971.1 hypothetical protein PUNSTDRAFT_138157 [Punctularia strigosozonata HHB-11173 SS5]